MVQIRDIHEANKILASYMPQVSELLGKDVTLERMVPLMELLGNPQDKLKIIHIAGTSGKTSTAYYVASLLKQAGQKVGMTVSPHIDSVTERVQINLEPIPESEFCMQLGTFIEQIQKVSFKPTYFEIIIAFAYWYFVKQKVDYAVIETGLGGLQDATNVAGNRDKVCAVTDIGFDHTHILGGTIEEIATQKAGIIHANNQVFMYKQSPSIMEVFVNTIKSKYAKLNVLSDFETLSREVQSSDFDALPEFQKRNWFLANQVFGYISERDNLPALTEDKLGASTKIVVPGRMDVRQIDGKTIVMDGAHNQQKMKIFVASYTKLYPNQNADILLSLKRGKEYQEVLPLLLPICSKLIITTFDVLQDLPSKSIDPQILAESAKSIGFQNIEIIPSPKDAYQKLLESPTETKIITGSFYLLSCVRPYII